MPYKPTVIRNFRGLSQTLALTAGSPEYALACVNVLPSIAGLAKLRIPPVLTPAIDGIGSGPDQFAMFDGAFKAVLGFFGQQVYVISLDDFTPTIFDSNPNYQGAAPWSVVMSNNFAFMQNGTSIPLKYTGSGPFEFWGIQPGAAPTIGAASGTGITLTIGRQYRLAYENGVTVHVGTASAPSASTGPLANKTQALTLPAPPFTDNQINKGRLYATLDGGADYFLHSVQDGPFPIAVNDATPDADLDQSERAPLINNQPPIALYTCLWGGRIFMFNLPIENSKWVAYTGYNRIFVGRPEESCPPGNRIKLETGADSIAGGGVMKAGVIVFDRTDKMFMFRGQPEDITIDAPVEFTLYLEQLPWKIGCASHFTIQSTPRGLVWLSSSLDVFLFDGQSQPLSIDEGAEPILRSTNFSQVQNSRSAYWQYKGRNWYVLGIPTESSSDLTKLLLFDLEPNVEKNFGIVPLDVGAFQSIGIVEMVDGEQKLVIGQGGFLKELTVTPTTVNGIEQNITSTSGTLGAFWEGGYIGNDAPEVDKFARWTRVTTDNGGFRLKRRLIQNDVTSPLIIEFVDVPTGGKVSTNKKAKRWSHEVRFPDEDISANMLELVDMAIPLAER